jgi:hypothetical protein
MLLLSRIPGKQRPFGKTGRNRVFFDHGRKTRKRGTPSSPVVLRVFVLVCIIKNKKEEILVIKKKHSKDEFDRLGT